uniref:Uncharacterized protein n=1 Tax=Romanomermis culicivorax TaxID=13658 RepID=A0A915KP96_ROMCU
MYDKRQYNKTNDSPMIAADLIRLAKKIVDIFEIKNVISSTLPHLKGTKMQQVAREINQV